MRLVDSTGGLCPGEVLGYARNLYKQSVNIVNRPGKRSSAYPLADSQSDLFLIDILYAVSPVNDRVMIINGNPFRVVSAIDNTIAWAGGVAPFTVAVQTSGLAPGTLVNVDESIYTINSGEAREFTVMKIDETDTDTADNDILLGWWAADDDLVDGKALQQHVGVIIVDSSPVPREIFAPFGGLTIGDNVIYEHYGPESWCEPTIHWVPPTNMVYGGTLRVGFELNATAHAPRSTTELPGQFYYWLDDEYTVPAEDTIPDASIGLPLFVTFQADDNVHYHLAYGHHHLGHGDGEIIIEKANQSFVGGGIPFGYFYPGDSFDCVIYDYHFSGLPLDILTTTPDTLTISNIHVLYDDPTPAHATWPATHFTVTVEAEGTATLIERLEGNNNYNEYSKTFSWLVAHKASFAGSGGSVLSGECLVIRENIYIGEGGGVVFGNGLEIVEVFFTSEMECIGGGHADQICEVDFVGSGGAVIGGTGAPCTLTMIEGSGGAVISGTVSWIKERHVVSSGGAVGWGNAATNVIQFKVVIGSGGAVAAGSASVKPQQTFVGSGGIVAGGTAYVTRANYLVPDITFTLPDSIIEGQNLAAYAATSSVVGLEFTYHQGSPSGPIINMNSPQSFNTGLMIYAVSVPTAGYLSAYTWDGVVVKGIPVITWADPAAITYGTALSGTQLNATANVPGSFAYSPAAGNVPNANRGLVLNVTFYPTDTTHYTSASDWAELVVNKANQTISAFSIDTNNYMSMDYKRVYDAPTPSASSGLQVTLKSLTTSVCKMGSEVTVYGSYLGDSYIIGIANGTAIIEASQAGNANYNPAAPVTTSWTVTDAGIPTPVSYPPIGYSSSTEWLPDPGDTTATATVHLYGWTQYGLGITFELVSISGEVSDTAELAEGRVTGVSASWLQSPAFTVTANAGSTVVITYRVLNDAGNYSGNYTVSIVVPAMHWAPSMTSICLESYLSGWFITWCINGNKKQYLAMDGQFQDACDEWLNVGGWYGSSLAAYNASGTFSCLYASYENEFWWVYKEEIWTRS